MKIHEIIKEAGTTGTTGTTGTIPQGAQAPPKPGAPVAPPKPGAPVAPPKPGAPVAPMSPEQHDALAKLGIDEKDPKYKDILATIMNQQLK